MASNDKALRDHVVNVLGGGGAHATLEQAVKDFPERLRGKKVKGLTHSAWMLLEHIRIAQWDILEFSRNEKHESPDWPKGYWPESSEPPTGDAWEKSVRKIRKHLKEMAELVADPKTDLFAKIPWGDGQTILREALLIADHNAYHVAQIVDLRRLLGVWEK